MSYITGPAILRRGGVSFYFQDGIKLGLKSKTGQVQSDLHGKAIDTFLISRMGSVSGKPVDAIANLSSFFGLGISNVGESIFKGTSRSLTSISLATPGVITFAAAHNLGPAGTTITGTTAGIAGGVAPAEANGTLTLTITDATHATCGIAISSAGTGGTFTPDSEPLQIVSKNDAAIYTFERSGIMKAPPVHLGAGKGFFGGNVEFAVLGSATKAATAADYWMSAVSVAFADATFDETKFRRYRYTAAYGSTPYDAMRGQDGFDVAIDYSTEEIPDDNIGIGDIIFTGVTASAKFTPSNLTQAQILTLLKLQDAAALRPGDSISGAGATDLVITGTDATTSFTATLKSAGFTDADLQYATGKLRAGEIQAVTRRTWSAGTAASLFTFVAA